jgi:hypothetical protein
LLAEVLETNRYPKPLGVSIETTIVGGVGSASVGPRPDCEFAFMTERRIADVV